MITAASSTSALQTRLVSSGVSTAKAKLVQDDLDSALKATGAGGTARPASVRAALDQKIAADVASGKLSEADAATIGKALDRMGDASVAASGDSGAATGDAGAAQAAGGAHGGGGGGGGRSAAKTELSRIVTVAGAIKTTVVTYTDGTSETSTGAANAEDKARYGHADATDDADPQTKVGTYLAGIAPGSLVEGEA
ncbi:hypothetical protein HL653_21740 [Sphingomonas sp. AP4-R1]|uniref:hypothetical protein n=1 Tax=Sphingomonas sp. AP4-R1 TaxID=2735134 RepID=UPI0014933525|nr:hypothetical protein [Sphingomonas sp. AP4-R1]QJU60010.1 hypothetical protein HL653_21740 [Sphingomonas sp. AP4-R1]